MAVRDLCLNIASTFLRKQLLCQQILGQQGSNGTCAFSSQSAWSKSCVLGEAISENLLLHFDKRSIGCGTSKCASSFELYLKGTTGSRRFSKAVCLQRKLRSFPARVVARNEGQQMPEEPAGEMKTNMKVTDGAHASSLYATSQCESDVGPSGNDKGFAGTYRITGTSNDVSKSQLQWGQRDPAEADEFTTRPRGVNASRVKNARTSSQLWNEVRMDIPPVTPDKMDASQKSARRPPTVVGGGDLELEEIPPLRYKGSDAAEKSKKLRSRTGRNELELDFGETVSADLLEIKSKEWKMREGGKAKTKTNNYGHRDKNKRPQEVPATSRGSDLLYGVSPCLLALLSQQREVHQVFTTTSFHESARSEVKRIRAVAEERGLRVLKTGRAVLDKLSHQRPHQGICMEVSRLYFNALDAEDHPLGTPLRLVLDQIKDPMNLGALLRSAYFLGIDKVIVSKKNCCSLTPVVSKASSGVMEVLPVHATRNVPLFLQEQKSLGWRIVGASMGSTDITEDVIPCHKYERTSPLILVVGNEGFGLSPDIKDVCSEFISIPAGRQLHPGIDSLNVSVATGILLHSLLGRT